MEIAVRGRHIDISGELRSTVEEKVARLTRYLDGMDRADVQFSEERNPRISAKEVCEVTLHGHGHVVRARASAADSFAAVDRVIDKLEQQMIKLKGKLLGRSQPRRGSGQSSNGRAGAPAVESGELAAGSAPEEPRIVKSKRFAIKPMTPEEAALHLDLLGHGFYFFLNSETERAAVVYRRNDGNVGLIDAT